MDVDILFALLLLAFYLATQIFGRKKRTPTAPPPEAAEHVPAGRDPHSADVEDALREIREALGWPSEPEPAPSSPPPAPAPPERDRRTTLEKSRPARPAKKPPTIGTPTGMNEWEIAQERAAKRKAEATAMFGELGGIPDVTQPRRGRGLHPIARKLRSPQGAHDAVIYSEIFLPRWKNDIH
jgi:hypothetical protein